MSENAADKAMETLVGTAVYGFARAMIAGGVEPGMAVRLTAFGIIEGTMGREATESLGIPRPTLSRWRRELASVAEGVSDKLDDPELEIQLLNEMLPALGFRDLRVHREVRDDG